MSEILKTPNLSKCSLAPNLTLNCLRYPHLPLMHKAWNPPPKKKKKKKKKKKTLSDRNFLIISTSYMYTKIKTIFQQKRKKCTVSKWRPINRFSFQVTSISAKI